MNTTGLELSNTHLNMSLYRYVVYMQQQMKQTDDMLVDPGRTAKQQTKRELIISRELVRPPP